MTDRVVSRGPSLPERPRRGKTRQVRVPGRFDRLPEEIRPGPVAGVVGVEPVRRRVDVVAQRPEAPGGVVDMDPVMTVEGDEIGQSVRFSVGSPDRGRGRRVASCLRCASVFAGSEPDPAISIFSRRSIGVRVQRMKQMEAGSASRTSRMTVSGGDAMRARGSASVM